MTLHWLSATRLEAQLAAGRVTAREQAFYLASGFVVWMIPGYLFIIPSLSPDDTKWFFGMWFYEFAMLVLVNVAGTFYCLGKCHVDPRRNFLVDFSCLYLPVSVTTLIVTWGVFHGLLALRGPWLLLLERAFERPPALLGAFASVRFFELLRFLAIVGSAFAVFYRTGRHMARVAAMRRTGAGAPPAVPRTMPAG
jgi:hypothetical protein